jgi:hypothetical protein
MTAMTTRRLPLVASGVFFCAYLLFQTVYPMLPWFLPGFGKFTWHMYAARDLDPQFTVIFADGSRREVGNPLKVGSPVRVLGPSIGQKDYVPAWLCANWKGAERVVLQSEATGDTVVLPCHSLTR